MKLSDKENEAIELSRKLAGAEEIPTSAPVEETGISQEELKKKKNKAEENRIKQYGLRPNAMFSYTLLTWEEKAKTINCKYPTTKQAIRYLKLGMSPETQKIEFSFNEFLEGFMADGLLINFDIEEFPASEANDLAQFLSAVVQNPRLK